MDNWILRLEIFNIKYSLRLTNLICLNKCGLNYLRVLVLEYFQKEEVMIKQDYYHLNQGSV